MGASYRENCINALENYKIPSQVGGTCYANALAGIMKMASDRVHGREELDFGSLRQFLINKYGYNGAVIENILFRSDILKRYRLRASTISENEAIQIASKGRPLLATFYLPGKEWDNLSEFYKNNPYSILTYDILKYRSPSRRSSEDGGHAVILTRYDSYNDSFEFANSWGNNWASRGYFYVKKGAINFTFYDIFWYESDLTDEERYKYKRDYPDD